MSYGYREQQYGYGGGGAQGYDFGEFDYNSPSSSAQQPDSFAPYPGPSGSGKPALFTPSSDLNQDPFGAGNDPFADEPPLLEELGINFDQITQKTLAVLNPFRHPEPAILHDSDLAGPLVFGLAFGCFLLLSGKVTFSYIYGFGLFGCVAIYALLNLMAPSEKSITVSCTVSVLGYCLLPMVILSGFSVIINLKTFFLGTPLTFFFILWCAISAANLFAIALSLHNQHALVAYPCALLYGVFALITIF